MTLQRMCQPQEAVPTQCNVLIPNATQAAMALIQDAHISKGTFIAPRDPRSCVEDLKYA